MQQFATLPVQLEREGDRAARIVVAHVEHTEIRVVSLSDVEFARAGRVGRSALPDEVRNLAGQRKSRPAYGRLAAEDTHARIGIGREPSMIQGVEGLKPKLSVPLVVLPRIDVLEQRSVQVGLPGGAHPVEAPGRVARLAVCRTGKG